MKIVLAGPPRSGKSCLREGLKQAIRQIPGAPYPYVITACPDGEGAWFQETAERSSDHARALKERYKELLGGFSPEFVHRVSESVSNCTLELTLVDIGGIPSKENYAICASATHIVLLAGNDPKTGENWQDRLSVWREFAEDLGLVVVAEIFSDYHGTEDKVRGADPNGILRGSVHFLERGENLSGRPMIGTLAEHLVQMTGDEEK